MKEPQYPQLNAPPPLAPPPVYQTQMQVKTSPVSQKFGAFIASIFIIFCGNGIINRLSSAIMFRQYPVMLLIQIAHLISVSLRFYFFIQVIRLPEYLGGNPNSKKFTPIYIDLGLNMLRIVFAGVLISAEYSVIKDIVLEFLFFFVCLAMYNHDDSKGSCCLCFKPWTFRDSAFVEEKASSHPEAIQYNYPTRPYPYPGYNNNGPLQPV